MHKTITTVICFLYLVGHSYALNSTTDEQIAYGLQLATATVTAIKTNDFNTFINQFATISIQISSTLGVYGNAFALLMSLFTIGQSSGGNPELEQIQKSLNDINSHLDSIQLQMNEIANKLVDEIRTTQYKLHIDQIVELQGDQQSYIKTPNELTKKRLIEACAKYSMIDFLTWLHNDITQNTVQSIMTVVTKNLDRKKLMAWSKLFAANIMQANFLHVSCVPLQNQQTDLTIIGNTLKADAIKLSQYSTEIKNTLKAADNRILSSFWSQAQSEIDTFLIDNRNVANKDFVVKLYDQLNGKYDWKAWTVVSYNGDTSGSSEHTALTYDATSSRLWLRVQNRNLFVVAGNVFPESWKTRALFCETNLPQMYDNAYKSNYCSNYDKSDTCYRLAYALYCCSGSISGIIVVKAGHDFWIQYNRDGSIFSYDNGYSHVVSY